MHTVAISSLKGGVGKTTTTFHLAGALAEAGHTVLAIDADPQGCLTGCFRAESDSGAGLAEVLCGQATVATAAVRTGISGLWVLPASPRLETIHRRNLAGERVLQARMTHTCDFVLIDCPSAPGVLLANALTAADSVLIPVAARGLARGAVGRIIGAVREMRDRGGHTDLDILGLLLTQIDRRSGTGRRVEREVRQEFGALVFEDAIHESERIADATDRGRPMTVEAPGSRAADEIRRVAGELTSRAAARSGYFGHRKRSGELRVIDGKVAAAGGGG